MMPSLRLASLAAILMFSGSALASRSAAQCSFVLDQAHVWTGSDFAVRDVAVSDGRFVDQAPANAPHIKAQKFYLIPPFADAHIHLDQLSDDTRQTHDRLLHQGVFYALNPNNVLDPPRPLTDDEVETVYAGGGLTRVGGHPRPVYEAAVRNGWRPDLGIAGLAGRAFHEVTTGEEARAAVDAVAATGVPVIKLYLHAHDLPRSAGLTPLTFRAAVRHARERGLRPIVHVFDAADFRLAESEDVAVIAHLSGQNPRAEDPDETYFLTPDDAARAKAKGIIVVTTITIPFYFRSGPALAAAQRIQNHNLKILRDGGVELAAGADRDGASVIDELALLRASTLFDGTQLLQIGTQNGTDAIFPGRKIGRIQPGYEASFLILPVDPRNAWPEIANLKAGVRGGRLIFDNQRVFASTCLANKHR